MTMATSVSLANLIMDNIQNGTMALGLIKKDVEDFLRIDDGTNSRSKFAIKFMNKLALSVPVRLQNGTLINDCNFSKLVATIVACHENIFNCGYDCTDEEDSQIGRCLYSILFNIIDKNLKEVMVVSNLIVKSFSRSYRVPAAYVGPIVRNSFILLWNASLKYEHLPAEALRLRLDALTHLSLSGDPKCAFKFCDRAFNSALLYASTADKNREFQVTELCNFTSTVLDLFDSRFLALFNYANDKESQNSIEKLVRLIHLTMHVNLKSGHHDVDKFMVNVFGGSKRLRKFLNRTGSVQFGFNVIDFASTLAKIIAGKLANHLMDEKLKLLVTLTENVCVAKFIAFDKNCFEVAVATSRVVLRSLVEKSSTDTSVVHVLAPQFHQIVIFFNKIVQLAASVLITTDDSIQLICHLTLYQFHHLKIMADTNETLFRDHLPIACDTINKYHKFAVTTVNNGQEKFETFVQHMFYVASVPYAKKMYAETAIIIQPYAESIIENFIGDDSSSDSTLSLSETFWKRMAVLVQCLNKTQKFYEALKLLALFMSKGHVEYDTKALALWALVKREARVQKDNCVSAISISKLVIPLCCSTDESLRSRLTSLLAAEVEILKTKQCPADEIYLVLCDLLTFCDDPLKTSSILIQMARILIGKDKKYDREERTTSDCCRRALNLLRDSSVIQSKFLIVQATFVAYLDNLRRVYEALDGKVNRHRARQVEWMQTQKKEAERINAAAAAADSDTDAAQNMDDFASFQPSNVSEELETMTGLDSCVDAWALMLSDDECLESETFGLEFLNDLKLAADIYTNAQIFQREITTRQLYVKLAKRLEKWAEYVKGSSLLIRSLARLGLVDIASQVLQEAESEFSRLESCGVRVEELTQASIALKLACSELRLVQGCIIDGFKHLSSAMDIIRVEKKCMTMMLLEGRSLLLHSKYTEFSSPTSGFSSPSESSTAALRIFVQLLQICSKGNSVEQFNVELIGCLLDSGFQLGRLFYDVGLIRDARFYLREQLSWTQRFFCVSRTAEVLLLFAKIDLAIGEECGCQTKLNAVRCVIDSTNSNGLQSSKIFGPPSPLSTNQDVCGSSDEDDFLSTQINSDRVLAKLPPVSQLKSSPGLSPSTSSRSTMDIFLFRDHQENCQCMVCSNVALLRIRADFILVNHELAGLPRDAEIFQVVKSLSRSEKKHLAVISTTESSPPSQIDIAICWTLSIIAESLLDAKDGVQASRVVNSAMSLLGKIQIKLGPLNFLQATLVYQKCLSTLLRKACTDGRKSVSELCETAWLHGHLIDSSDVDRLTIDLELLGLSEISKTPGCHFKTPKRKALKSKDIDDEKTTATKVSSVLSSRTKMKKVKSTRDDTVRMLKIGHRAPAKTAIKSLFNHDFDDGDSIYINPVLKLDDGDNEMTIKSSDEVDVSVSAKKSRTPKRRAITTMTVLEKENSDIDDLISSPVVIKKKKNLTLRSTSRTLRSKSKLEVLEQNGDADTANPKHLFESPLSNSSRMNVERGRTVATRTRSTVVVDELKDVEYFRTQSPICKVEKLVRWRTKVKMSKVEPDNVETGEVDFDMDVIVKELDEALRAIDNYPKVPLYGNLNILLALCKGDKGVQTLKTEPRNGVEHILETVGISFRHYASFRLYSTQMSDSISDMYKISERRRLFGHSEGSLLSKNNDGEGIQRLTNKLPKDWVVCQINALPMAFSGMTSNPELVLTRLENGRKPIMVHIRNNHNCSGVRDFLSEFTAILTESKLKIRTTTSSEWWDTRKALDARLQMFFSSLEDTWLGAWKCLLLGRPMAKEISKQLNDAMRELSVQLTTTVGISSVDEQLLELVLDSWTFLKERRDCWRPALARVCRLKDLSDTRIDDVYSLVNVRNVGLWTAEETRRQVVVLILDKVLHCLPLENIPILRDQAVTRMPSIHSLLAHLSLHLGKKINDCDKPVPKVDTSNAHYVLNPSRDLANTEKTLAPLFQGFKWSGVPGRAPTPEEWVDALSHKDLFVYAGHGSGSFFARGDKIDKGVCRAVALIIGCSSALLRDQGPRFEPFGVCYNYLIAGCPYMMGNLWDVTDKDIDRFLVTLLKHWMPGNGQLDSSLVHVVPMARLGTTLGYLIGAAPVAYGIPVYS